MLGGGKLYSGASGVPLCGDPLACSCHQGWVGGRTWWEASYIDHHCVASLPHVLVGYSHHSGLEEDKICLEVAYTDPLVTGVPLWKTCVCHTEEDDTLCSGVTCIHSFHAALVDYSCLTFGVGDSFWWAAGNFHGF